MSFLSLKGLAQFLRVFFLSILLSSPLLLGGCGKYGRPYPPEKLSPESLSITSIEGLPEGIKFTWEAPLDDARGRRLKSLLGYRIYRKVLTTAADIADPAIDFEEVALVEDVAYKALEVRREEARKEQKPSERLTLNDDEREVTYTDTAVKEGEIYLYKIVAYNHPWYDGDVRKFVRVVFRGDKSEFSNVDNADTDLANVDNFNTSEPDDLNQNKI